jgi:hypothetical protein
MVVGINFLFRRGIHRRARCFNCSFSCRAVLRIAELQAAGRTSDFAAIRRFCLTAENIHSLAFVG